MTVKDCKAGVANFTKYLVKMVEQNTTRLIRMYMVFIKLVCMYQVQKTFTRICIYELYIPQSTSSQCPLVH